MILAPKVFEPGSCIFGNGWGLFARNSTQVTPDIVILISTEGVHVAVYRVDSIQVISTALRASFVPGISALRELLDKTMSNQTELLDKTKTSWL
jgi:hypothetical protein